MSQLIALKATTPQQYDRSVNIDTHITAYIRLSSPCLFDCLFTEN